ncbi:hypothetical protein GGS23DRAFT_92611 [Durotheca rogersii]|uniref:uncharacterized protein n=1 Tax=Durotheca rogersii TaxID=419775 RepID=UPI00221F9F14|nr:uncharacterized protein GGS23DRAFT_92611 [Durotheca rogersii]KAI5862316.1 hypothetical protein GGS23DRAFT_92611 [Durotheca rogersii]
MTDAASKDKRRRQNRDSQRRFRERNKARQSLSLSLAGQIGPPISSPVSLLSGSNSTSPEQNSAASHIPSGTSSLLSSEGLPSTTTEWTSARAITSPSSRGDVRYRHTQSYYSNPSSAPPHLGLPPLAAVYSMDDMSMLSTNRDAGSYHQQQDFGHVMQVAGSAKDVVLSPISLLGAADLQMGGTEPSRPSRVEEQLRRPPRRRASESRAEQMISDVERLYEFGVHLSIFPEDVSLQNSLRKMKERFRALARTDMSAGGGIGGSSGSRKSLDAAIGSGAASDIYEGSTRESDSEEESSLYRQGPQKSGFFERQDVGQCRPAGSSLS